MRIVNGDENCWPSDKISKSRHLSVLKRCVPKTLAFAFGLRLRSKTRCFKTRVLGRRSPNGKPQERLRFRALRSKTLAFKNCIAIFFLRFKDFPRCHSLRLGHLRSKNTEFCVCDSKPAKVDIKAATLGNKPLKLLKSECAKGAEKASFREAVARNGVFGESILWVQKKGPFKGVFWKRGLFRKVHFLEILENLEILEILEKFCPLPP